MAHTGRTGKPHPPLRLRLVLIILILSVGILPVIFQSAFVNDSFLNVVTEEQTSEMQNRAHVLAAKLSRSGYLRAPEQNSALNAEMDAVASSYNGRILVVDRTYRIVRDSFRIADGRFHVAPEVIRAFRGENLNAYNASLNYIIQTAPIYESAWEDPVSGQERPISGLLLFLASTEKLHAYVDRSLSRMSLLNLSISILLFGIAAVASGLIVRPFSELRDSLSGVANGDLNRSVRQDTYVVTRDISEQINRMLERVKTMDRSRDEFVSNVSHELKTPITSIRVLADSLMGMDEVPNELYKDFMNDISREIDREAKIIDDLLSLVKLDRSGTPMNYQKTDIREMLEQILKRLRPIARKNNIELTLESQREVTADVDEVKLSLAISNLVENAVKYNVKDGWVRVTLDADHQFFYIKVADSGIGIPESEREHVFERFYRVDKARSRESGGTGLGLSITRNIILLHQGVVNVTGEEGKGTVFQVRLPITHIERSQPQEKR